MEEMEEITKPSIDTDDDFDTMSSTSSDFSFVSRPDSHSDYEEISIADAMNGTSIDGDDEDSPSALSESQLTEEPSLQAMGDHNYCVPPAAEVELEEAEVVEVQTTEAEVVEVQTTEAEVVEVQTTDAEVVEVQTTPQQDEANVVTVEPLQNEAITVTSELLQEEALMLKDELTHKSVVVREQPRREVTSDGEVFVKEAQQCLSDVPFVPRMLQVADSSFSQNSSISQAYSLKSRKEFSLEPRSSLNVENDIMKQLVSKQKTELDRYDMMYRRDQLEIKHLRSETRALFSKLDTHESSIETLNREKWRLQTNDVALNRTLEKCVLKEEELMEMTEELNSLLESAEKERVKLKDALNSCQARVDTLQEELTDYKVKAQEDASKLIEAENFIQILNFEKAEVNIKLADETQKSVQLEKQLGNMETDFANTLRNKEESRCKISLLERQIKDFQLRQDVRMTMNQDWEILSDFEPSQHSDSDQHLNLMSRPDPNHDEPAEKNNLDDFDLKLSNGVASLSSVKHARSQDVSEVLQLTRARLEEDCERSDNTDSEGEEIHIEFDDKENTKQPKKVDDITGKDQTKIDEEMAAERQNILQAYGVILKKRSEHQKKTTAIKSFYHGGNDEGNMNGNGAKIVHPEELTHKYMFAETPDHLALGESDKDVEENDNGANIVRTGRRRCEFIVSESLDFLDFEEETMSSEETSTEQNDEAISKIVANESLATEKNDEAILNTVANESLATEKNDEAILKIVAEESLATEQNEDEILKIVAEESLATEQNEDEVLQTTYDNPLAAEQNEVFMERMREESQTSEVPNQRTREYSADTIRVNLDEGFQDDPYSMEGRENRNYFSNLPRTGFTAPVFMPQPTAPTVDVLPSPLQPNLTNIAKRAAVAGANQIIKSVASAIQIIQDTPWDSLVTDNTYSNVNRSGETPRDDDQQDNPTRPVSPNRNVEPHPADDDSLYGATAMKPKNKCPLCPMEFLSTPEGIAAANKHANEHLDVPEPIPETQYVCPFCSLKFDLNCFELYTDHVESHLENTCPICGDIFAKGERKRYENHVNGHFDALEEEATNWYEPNSLHNHVRFAEID